MTSENYFGITKIICALVQFSIHYNNKNRILKKRSRTLKIAADLYDLQPVKTD